jgi:hypothetical protein
MTSRRLAESVALARVVQAARLQAARAEVIALGDKPGHPFRGNQYGMSKALGFAELAVQYPGLHDVRPEHRERAVAFLNATRGDGWEHDKEATRALAREADVLGVKFWPTPLPSTRDEVLRGRASTQDAHSRVDKETGQRVYSDDRRQVHDQIVDKYLASHQPPADGRPEVLWMAGGGGAGKSHALEHTPQGRAFRPHDAVHIDVDKIKADIPEYAEMVRRGDKAAAAAVHHESVTIGAILQRRAQERGLNMVIDGTGNGSSPTTFMGKIAAVRATGYKTKVMYVDTPTDVAYVRATRRAMETGRWVPGTELRFAHSHSSLNARGVFRDVKQHGDIEVIGFRSLGGGSKIMFQSRGRDVSVRDPQAANSFFDKAGEF